MALPSPGGRATFGSSDPRVATVTEGGVVTGVGEGRATIRATVAMPGIGGRLWEWALIIIGRVLGEHDPIAQTVTREFGVVVRPKADGRPADSDGDGIIDAGEASLGTDPLSPTPTATGSVTTRSFSSGPIRSRPTDTTRRATATGTGWPTWTRRRDTGRTRTRRTRTSTGSVTTRRWSRTRRTR